MIARGYTRATRLEHRTVLRAFSRFSARSPGETNANHVREYLHELANRGASWSWLGMNISGLRNVFDKVNGLSLTAGLHTPKRPHHLPEILSTGEVIRILDAAVTPRDRILLGLLYGCGLKISEACTLRWTDLDMASSVINVVYEPQCKTRHQRHPPLRHLHPRRPGPSF